MPSVAGKNRFNPTFVPDGSLLLFSEVDQASYSGTHVNSCNEANVTSNGRFCNGYSDPGAKTWAVVPEAGATPVFLANAVWGWVLWRRTITIEATVLATA